MPRGHRRAPGVQLIVPDPSAKLLVSIDHLPEAEQDQITAVVPWVAGLRAARSREWPARGVSQGRPGHYPRTYPCPECWPLHPDLVMEFIMLRIWTEAIESGELSLRDFGGEYDRWSRHITDMTVPQVRKISQLCVASGTTIHVDPSVERPGAEKSREHRWGMPVRPVRTTYHPKGARTGERGRPIEL